MHILGLIFFLFLSLSVAAEPAPISDTNPSFRDFTFNVGLLYSTLHEYQTKGELRPSLTEFDGEIKTKAAFGFSLGFNYRQTATTNWFINGGLLVELPRKIEHEILSDAYVATGSTSQARLLYTALFSNFAYEVASPFYLTAGAGLGSMAISHYEPELDAHVGLLFQAGIGTHFLNQRFHFELLGRYQGMTAERDSGATKTVYDNITGTGIVLHLKTRIF